MPGLANELLMLAEEARTRRSRPVLQVEARVRIWPWVVLGITFGGIVGFILGTL